MFGDMLGIVFTAAALGTFALYTLLVAGTTVAHWWISQQGDEAQQRQIIDAMENERKIREQEIAAGRYRDDGMVDFYREIIPEDWKRLREQEEKERQFIASEAGLDRRSEQHMQMMDKLIPANIPGTDVGEIGIGMVQALSSSIGPPSVLPFDPNVPITAFSQ